MTGPRTQRTSLAKLKVKLIDKALDSQGSSSIEVSSGSLVPAGSERMTRTRPPT